jgi:hypothetical protein
MPRCVGSKPDNSPCERVVKASLTYCFAHDPARKEARHRNASKAARSKPGRELTEAKRDILDVIKGVREESIDRPVGAVVFQGYNTFLKALDVERRWRENEELARELEELREMVERDAGRGEVRRSAWGA